MPPKYPASAMGRNDRGNSPAWPSAQRIARHHPRCLSGRRAAGIAACFCAVWCAIDSLMGSPSGLPGPPRLCMPTLPLPTGMDLLLCRIGFTLLNLRRIVRRRLFGVGIDGDQAPNLTSPNTGIRIAGPKFQGIQQPVNASDVGNVNRCCVMVHVVFCRCGFCWSLDHAQVGIVVIDPVTNAGTARPLPEGGPIEAAQPPTAASAMPRHLSPVRSADGTTMVVETSNGGGATTADGRPTAVEGPAPARPWQIWEKAEQRW